MSPRRLHRYRDREALAQAVAGRLLTELVELQGKQPLATVGVAGGRTVLAVMQELAHRVRGSALDPARVDLWWADESYTATVEEDRHAGKLLEVLAGSYTLSPARVHPMPARTGAMDVTDAALQYAAELGQTRFDVCLLSIGTHGEVAALFDADPDTTSTVVAIDEAPIAPPERISVTLPAINRSREVWVLASGAEKAAAVTAALGETPTSAAGLVNGTGATRWFLDDDAAAGLPRHDCGW